MEAKSSGPRLSNFYFKSSAISANCAKAASRSSAISSAITCGVDEFTRECLALVVRRSFRAKDVIGVLAELIAQRGVPAHLRSDNGPEFVAQAVQAWLKSNAIEALYIAPGSPWENAYVESFNSRLRDEHLNREEFASLLEAQVLAAAWRRDYNEARPHSALEYLAPAAFAARGRAAVGATPLPAPASAETLKP